MDLNEIKNLDPEQKSRYMKLERTFGTEGWDIVVEYLKIQAEDAKNRELDAKTWEENRTWRGARLAFTIAANIADITEKEFTALAEQNADKEQVENEIEHE